MAGRRAPSRTATVFAQTPKVADANTQRAFDVHSQAILDLQARRHLEQFSSTEPGYVPESGGGEFYFLAADGEWKVITGAGAVDSVTAGSSMVSVSPSTGNVVVDVVPANFTGIPMSGITFSGTNNRLAKFSGATLADSTITDTGSLVTIASPINVTGAADFDLSVLINSTLTVNGAVDFDAALDVDGAVNLDSTLTLSTFTQGSVLFIGAAGLVSQDNPNFFWDDANNRHGIGTSLPSVTLHTVGVGAFTGGSNGLYVGATGITRTGVTGFTETNVEFTRDTANTVVFSTYGSAATDIPSLQVFRARGSASASAAVQSGDVIGTMGFTGATSATAHHSGAYVIATATENWATGTNVGTKLEFITSQNATSAALGRAVRMRIEHNGGVTVIAQGAVTDVINPQHTGTGLTANTAMFSAVPTMTFDTTAAGLNCYVLYADASATRSAGANSLSNIAGRFRARNAQVNVAIRTDEGNVTLNVISGITAIGPNFTTDPNAQLHVRVSASGAAAAAAGSTIVSEVNGVSYITIKGPASTEKGVLFSNTTAANDGAILYDNSGFARGLQLRAAGVNYVTISSAGAVTVGSATTQAHTINGRVALTSTTATASADSSTWTPAAGTTNTLAAFVATNSGTFNTTAGVLSEFALRAVSSASRSTGANSLTGVGGYFSSTGAQVNVAIQSDAGSNYLNTTSGSTGVGYALGAALPSTLSVTGSGTFTTTLDVTGNFNVNTNKFSVVAASGNTTVAGTLAVNGNVTLGDAATDSHTINGNVVHTETAGTAYALTSTPSAETAATWGLDVQVGGTSNATAGAIENYGVLGRVTTSRSAGANSVVNRAGYFNAANGQVNYAIYTDNGDVQLNTTSGTTTCVRDFAVNGNATICDGSGDTLKFYGGTGATKQTVTGSRAGNAALADLLTKLATLGMFTDGTTA